MGLPPGGSLLCNEPHPPLPSPHLLSAPQRSPVNDFREFFALRLAELQAQVASAHEAAMQVLERENAALRAEVAEAIPPLKEEAVCSCNVPSDASPGDTPRFSCAQIAQEQIEDEADVIADIHPDWVLASKCQLPKSKSMLLQAERLPGLFQSENDLDAEQGVDCTWFERFAVHPQSTKRLCWDAFGFMCVSYDAVTVPFEAFEAPASPITSTLRNATRIYWLFDIPWSFITYRVKPSGISEANFGQVAKRYMGNWFLVDLSLVAIDCADFFTNDKDTANTSLFMRLVRILRTVRLLRVMRLVFNCPEIAKVVAYRIPSERLLILLGVGKIVVGVLGLSHTVACCWYLVGRGGGNDGWVQKTGMVNEPVAFQYTYSLIWSLAHFVGAGDATPHNLREGLFTGVVMIAVFVISVSIVSSLTTLMTRFQLAAARLNTQLSTLDRFLRDHSISRKLATRVQVNARHVIEEMKKDTPEASVELLGLISDPLLVELHYEVYAPVLMQHPFFKLYGSTNPTGMRQVCHSAVGRLQLSRGDVHSLAGEALSDPGMLFVSRGSLRQLSEVRSERLVHPGGWVCEPVLWLRVWLHGGTLRAASECQLCVLNAARFRRIAAQVQKVREDYTAAYAMAFVEALHALRSHMLTSILEEMVDVDCLVTQVFTATVVNQRRRCGVWPRVSSGSCNSALVSPIQSQSAWDTRANAAAMRNGDRNCEGPTSAPEENEAGVPRTVNSLASPVPQSRVMPM